MFLAGHDFPCTYCMITSFLIPSVLQLAPYLDHKNSYPKLQRCQQIETAKQTATVPRISVLLYEEASFLRNDCTIIRELVVQFNIVSDAHCGDLLNCSHLSGELLLESLLQFRDDQLSLQKARGSHHQFYLTSFRTKASDVFNLVHQTHQKSQKLSVVTQRR